MGTNSAFNKTTRIQKMPSTAVCTGSKTVTTNISPALTASVITNLLAIPVEQLTIAQLDALKDATKRVPYGGTPTSVLYDLFK
jgi:hypothetical protein